MSPRNAVSVAPPVASVLFAAGRGERLRPLTDVLPKAALPLLDIPLGAFSLSKLAAVAWPVAVNLSHLAPQLIAALRPFAPHDRVQWFDEGPEPLGTGSTLAALADRTAGPLLTWNADVLTDLDPARLLDSHRRLGGPATVACHQVRTGADLGLQGGRITGFIDRYRRPEAGGALFLGAAVFEKDALALLAERRPSDLARGLLEPLAKSGELGLHRHEGYALDVGTVERYLRACSDLLGGLGPEPPAPWPGRVIEAGGARSYVGPRWS